MSDVQETTEFLLEESIPWEVRLLKEYCNSTADLDSVSWLETIAIAHSASCPL